MRSDMKRLAKRLSRWASGAEAAAEAAVHAASGRCGELAGNAAPVQSGALRDGIGVRRDGGLSAAVVSTAEHSAMVEYGTSRMPPRPFMLESARAVQHEFFEAAKDALREVLK